MANRRRGLLAVSAPLSAKRPRCVASTSTAAIIAAPSSAARHSWSLAPSSSACPGGWWLPPLAPRGPPRCSSDLSSCWFLIAAQGSWQGGYWLRCYNSDEIKNIKKLAGLLIY
ncbi:unnamed protein product [Urochloa humidicola]